jgi:hypothetical protein
MDFIGEGMSFISIDVVINLHFKLFYMPLMSRDNRICVLLCGIKF